MTSLFVLLKYLCAFIRWKGAHTVRDMERQMHVGSGGVADINVSADPQPFQNLNIAELLMAIRISLGFYLFIYLNYVF